MPSTLQYEKMLGRRLYILSFMKNDIYIILQCTKKHISIYLHEMNVVIKMYDRVKQTKSSQNEKLELL